MNVKIVANNFMVRNCIEYMICEYMDGDCNRYIDKIESVSDLKKEDIESTDYIFMHLTISNLNELKVLNLFKQQNLNIKILVIDLQGDINLYLKSIENNIDGYITDISDAEEFKYILKIISGGKPYFCGRTTKEILQKGMIHKQSQPLTKREEEILYCIGRGLSNKEISKELYVTECTVKKHITSIFSKLKIKSRSEAIVYLHNNYMN